MPPDRADEALRFERFDIHPAQRVLRVEGREVAIGARAFDLLLALARHPDRLVSKQELLDLAWPGVVVEEHNIAAQVSMLRKLLGPQAIATLPGRGYRLTAQAPAARRETAPEAPSGLGAASARTHLPRDLTPLLGRDADRHALSELVLRHRLVTVIGAGGVGKTLLAQHVLGALRAARRDGVCWIELASVGEASTLPDLVAEALGVRLGDGERLAALQAVVAPMEIVVALDNAEHLVADVARLAAALHAAAPGLHLLVTSQAPLRLAPEHLFRVEPLAVPHGPLPARVAQSFAAVALFVERARSADARFTLRDDDAQPVIDLCRQLDGLPLAIELAAARAPLLGVRKLAAAMQDRLGMLTRNRDAAAPARQQTLRAALEWSVGLLDERARTVFRRLGVVSGSATLALAQHVAADGPLDAWAVLEALGELVDRSLASVVADDEARASDDIEPRYRLLESMRLFALERLRAAGEEDAMRRRHAQAVAALFDAAWEDRWSGRVRALAWAERILPDASNAREAIGWARAAGEPALAVTIAATLFVALPPWVHGERMNLGDLCEELAERLEPGPLQLRAWHIAVRPMIQERQARSRALAAKALRVARARHRDAADRWALYRALADWIAAEATMAQPSGDELKAALAELRSLDDPAWPAQRRVDAANAVRWAHVALHGGEESIEQLRLTRRWVDMLEAAGEDSSRCMGSLIDAELTCGHVDEAVRLGDHVLGQLAGSRDEWSRMLVRFNLAQALLARDDAAGARPHLEAGWPMAVRFDLHANGSIVPALLAALERRPRTAARLAGFSDAAYARHDLIRHPMEVIARARTHELARAALGEAEFTRLFDEGKALRDEQFEGLAFAAVDSD